MLKLTYSFYRCLTPTCENIINNITHVKHFSTLSCRRKTCSSVFNQSSYLIPFIHTNQQWRPLANIRKRLRTKKPYGSSNAGKTVKQMSESFQPTLNHVSYGGQFDVRPEDESDSRNHFDESGPTDNDYVNKRTEVPPDFRIWEPVGKGNDICDGNSFKFKIVSYNVLAQYLLECHPYLYTHCSSWDLKWNVRAGRLFDEIYSLAPDILCLQEVQVSHLKSFYSKFEEIGYCGVFKQKTGHRQDGCAIYFKRSKFHMEDHISVEFYQPELPLLNRDNVGLALRLAPRGPGGPLVVATTHLLYNPKRTDVRLAQIQLFLAEIDRFAYYRNGNQSGHLPIILTGDLNSPPDSAVIQLLDRGHVSANSFRDNSDWSRIGVTDKCQHLAVYLNRLKGAATGATMIKINNSEVCGGRAGPSAEGQAATAGGEHAELFNSGELRHSLGLVSVYSQRKPDGSREASTFQDYWLTVDYIYFSRCSSLKLLERLRLPTTAECAALGPLPNHVYASDHLALAALFELKPPSANL